MEQKDGFSYTYIAPANQEVLNIRKKYLPQEESKLDKLKRLDHLVQNSGVVESLCAGVGGCLIFGLGMCLAMQVIGGGTALTVLGIVLGLVGFVGWGINYPIYKKLLEKGKAKYAYEIVELAREISEQ